MNLGGTSTAYKKDMATIKKKNGQKMKDTVTERRIMYRESIVEQMKLRVKSAIWNTSKQKHPITTSKRKKRIQKVMIA